MSDATAALRCEVLIYPATPEILKGSPFVKKSGLFPASAGSPLDWSCDYSSSEKMIRTFSFLGLILARHLMRQALVLTATATIKR